VYRQVHIGSAGVWSARSHEETSKMESARTGQVTSRTQILVGPLCRAGRIPKVFRTRAYEKQGPGEAKILSCGAEVRLSAFCL
jgi:hypothetical protein